jgi:hypothetical protein
MDIVSRVKTLNLPGGEYCVFGSGVLEIHGIRKANDVDLLVTEKLYQELKERGWKRKWFFWRMLWCKVIVNGQNEAFTNLHWAASYRPNTKDLIHRAEYYHGVSFLRLKDLLAFQLHLPRKKDVRGCRLIEEFLMETSR